MKEKKNIDRIFQEKFKDFEKSPDERIWKNISAELNKENKKRGIIIPLWWKVGGVAAGLALIVGTLLFNNPLEVENTEPGIVLDEKAGPEQDSDKDKHVNENGSDSVQYANNNEDSSNTETSENKSSTEALVTSKKDEKTAIHNGNITRQSNPGMTRSSQITHQEYQGPINKYERGKEVIKPEETLKESSGIIAETEPLIDSLTSEKLLTKNALAEIEEARKIEENKELIAESGQKRIRLSTFAAPVFYKNIGSGNEISPQFDNNNSSSEVTISYGVKVAYQISDKIKVRTGVSKINMSYNIQDISYSPVAISSSFENLTPAEGNLNIRSDVSRSGDFSNPAFAETSLASSIFTPGEINQQFGFVEIPVEVEYTIIDKRFGLNLIGGGSSLFLDNNRVDLVSGNESTNLGTASNINSTSFSTNIGVGLDYKLNDKFSFNLEPIFKYQINTFNNVNNVQPVNFGIYSGLSIRF